MYEPRNFFLGITAATVLALLGLLAPGLCAEECGTEAGSAVYPFPQRACLNGQLALPDRVFVKIESGEADATAMEYMKGIFEGHGISRVDEMGEEGEETAAVMTLGSGGPEHKTAFRQEGYSIKIQEKL